MLSTQLRGRGVTHKSPVHSVRIVATRRKRNTAMPPSTIFFVPRENQALRANQNSSTAKVSASAALPESTRAPRSGINGFQRASAMRAAPPTTIAAGRVQGNERFGPAFGVDTSMSRYPPADAGGSLRPVFTSYRLVEIGRAHV